MKKILLLLLIGINFLNADVNECMNDIYFANGIDTSEADAKNAKDEIQLQFEKYNPEAYKKVENWKVAYNHTHGIGIDLYEAMLQKMYHMTEQENRGTNGYLMFILNLDSTSSLFQYTFKGLTKKIASKAPEEVVKSYAQNVAKKLAKKSVKLYNEKWGKDFTEEELELIFNEVFDYLIDQAVGSYIDKSKDDILKEELEDIKKHYDSYTNSIKNGHGVVVVAHSQGNLFTNMVHYNFGFTGNDWMENYFSALGVASPANNILGENSPYITFDNDMIQLVPDSLPTNVTNPKRYYFKNAVGEKIETFFSVEAHSFIGSYMATDATRSTILGFIEQKIEEHKSRESQWETDQELNKDTEAYRITIKHKHDPSNILVNDEVYPFNTNGKLYPVHREYVKASCGGTSLTNVWDGQKEYEFWLINNPEEEKITRERKRELLGNIICCIRGEWANVYEYEIPGSEYCLKCYHYGKLIGHGFDYFTDEIKNYVPFITQMPPYNELLYSEHLFEYQRSANRELKNGLAPYLSQSSTYLNRVENESKTTFGESNILVERRTGLWSGGVEVGSSPGYITSPSILCPGDYAGKRTCKGSHYLDIYILEN